MTKRTKQKQFIRGFVIASRKKIEPRDRYFEDEKGKEIDYSKFEGYVKRANKKTLNNLFNMSVYGRKEDKKQCKKGGYIADYFDTLFI